MNEISLIDALRDPAMRHAIFTHAPLALAVIALGSAVWVLLRPASNCARRSHLYVAGMLALATLATFMSGERAEHAVKVKLSADAYRMLDEHETLGGIMRGMALLVLLFAAVAIWLRARAERRGASGGVHRLIDLLGVAAGVVAVGVVTLAAHHGGQLVYRFNVGTPALNAPPATSAAEQDDPRLAFFVKNVEPILADRCQRCHNPARASRTGGLDQTTMGAILQGGRTSPALIPGDPAGSLIMKRIRPAHPDDVMPPMGEPLTEAQIKAFETWIKDGAVWR